VLWGNKQSELLETKGDEFYDLGGKDIIISANAFPWSRVEKGYLPGDAERERHACFQETPKKNVIILMLIQWGMLEIKRPSNIR